MSPRAKVTAALTAGLAIVLAGTGLFLSARFAAGLQATQDRGLRLRASEVESAARAGRLPGTRGVPSDEGVAQLASAGGRVVAGTLDGRRLLLAPGQFVRARRGEILVDRPGDARIDERLRLLARPVHARGRLEVVVTGASRDDTMEALATLRRLEALGLGAALLLGAAGAWVVAGVAVRPVRRALAREQRFVADASHELRTPLAVLKGELEVARMEDGDAGELRASLASAEEEVDRLSRLAEDLLVLARSGDRGLPVRLDALDLDPVLERAARGRPGVTIAPSGLRVRADERRLAQAVGNLLDNAVAHGAPPVEVGAERRDGTVTVSVRDHGPGPPDGLGRAAFEPFRRGDAARAGDGAGLGLAIVDAVARAHGGRAELRDAGGGAVAELTVPTAG